MKLDERKKQQRVYNIKLNVEINFARDLQRHFLRNMRGIKFSHAILPAFSGWFKHLSCSY